MIKTALVANVTDPKEWFYNYWDESFFHEVQLILERGSGEIALVDNARDMVANTFVHLRSHMQTQMQKIAAATGDDSLHPKYLDRHKLGACVAGAFLHKGVFQRVQSITGDTWSKYAFFSNEILAFQCAINTLIAFLRVIVKKNQNSIDTTRLAILENFGVSYPPSQEDGLGYEFHIFRALRQCHIQRHCLPNLPTGGPRPPFDLFLFSTILFDIEHHNLNPLTANSVEFTDTNLAA